MNLSNLSLLCGIFSGLFVGLVVLLIIAAIVVFLKENAMPQSVPDGNEEHL